MRNGGVSLLKWTLQVLQSAKRHATSMVGMVGMVGMVLNLFHPALWNCGHSSCRPKINSYDRFLTAQRPSTVVLVILFQHAGKIHGWMQGRPGERAGRVVNPLVPLLDQQSLRTHSCLTTDARPEHGPRERFTAGASWGVGAM